MNRSSYTSNSKAGNKFLQERDCELLIKEFWAARQKQNTSRTGSTLRPLPPFPP